MNYAKWVSETEIIEPTSDDFLEDGVTLKNTSEWLELHKSEKPSDVTIFKDYTAKYSLFSIPGGSNKIIQSWTIVRWEPEGRVAKLDGDELVFPQRNEVNSKGQLVCNYQNLPNSKKIEDGWMLIEETMYPTDGKVYREIGTMIPDDKLGNKIKIVWVEATVLEPSGFSISKYKLRQKFREIGRESDLDAFLNSSPTIAKDWADAVVLDSTDSIVVAACEAFKTLLGLTSEQIDGLLESCRSDI